MPRNTRWLNLVQQSDVAANDSDKTLTVPGGKVWVLLLAYVKLVTTATVGNRQVDVHLRDASDNVLAKYQAGAVQAASLTREYQFAPGHPNDTAFVNGVMLRHLAHGIALPAGFDLRIFDSAAIDAAADDMDVRVLVEELTE